jgi:hypothetical protein
MLNKIAKKGFKAKKSKRNREKSVLKQKSRSEIAKKNRSETMRNEAKIYFFGFAKTSENEAKQDAFCFILLRSEN